MISGIDASARQFLADLSVTQAKTEVAQEEISSGLKFRNASDAPDQVGEILKLRADIARTEQVQSNLATVKTQVDTAEQAIEGAVQLVERARLLANSGVGGSVTAQTRLSIAQEVASIHDQLVGLSATQIGGRSVFGGDAEQSAPYAVDTVAPDTGGGVTQLTTADATRRIEDPLGNTFTVDRTAQQIFDHQSSPGVAAPDNIFTAVNQLRIALQANDQTGIVNAVGALTQAGDYLNQQLGFYGAVQNRISAASDLSQQLDLDFKAALSTRQDADLTQAIQELNQGQLQEQASLGARAKMRKTSLFDYMA